MVKVLIVDDSTIVTGMISGYLTGKGYRVAVTNSPFEAARKITEFNPDVLLLDLDLPGISGEEFIGLCRMRKSLNCRVVLISSTGEDEMKKLVGAGLAKDYFLKGGPLRELEQKVHAQAAVPRA